MRLYLEFFLKKIKAGLENEAGTGGNQRFYLFSASLIYLYFSRKKNKKIEIF